jgi:hypothetical protein
MHREGVGSAGLHLFRELSALAQQLTHPLSLGQRLGRIKSMFPARPPRPRQTFSGARSGTGTAVHTASFIGKCACRRFELSFISAPIGFICLKTMTSGWLLRRAYRRLSAV